MEFSKCKWCGKQLDARNGDECYQCFTVRLEVERNPEIAAKVLAHLTKRAADLANEPPKCTCFAYPRVESAGCLVHNPPIR